MVTKYKILEVTLERYFFDECLSLRRDGKSGGVHLHQLCVHQLCTAPQTIEFICVIFSQQANSLHATCKTRNPFQYPLLLALDTMGSNPDAPCFNAWSLPSLMVNIWSNNSANSWYSISPSPLGSA